MNKSQRSNAFIFLMAFAAASGLSAGAAAVEIDNEQMGQLVGGGVGGALGSSIGGGNGKTAAAIGGALLGACYGGKRGANCNTAPQYGSAASPAWNCAPSPYAAAPAQPDARAPVVQAPPDASAPVADADDPSSQRQAQIDGRIWRLGQRTGAAVRDGALETWQAMRYNRQVSYVRFNERHALRDYGYLSAASQADLNRQLERINARLQNGVTAARRSQRARRAAAGAGAASVALAHVRAC